MNAREQIPEVARFPMAGGSSILVSLRCHAELHHKTSQNLREIGPSVHDGREPANGVMGMFVLTNQTLCLVACARHGGRAGYWLVGPGLTVSYHQSWIITWTRWQVRAGSGSQAGS